MIKRMQIAGAIVCAGMLAAACAAMSTLCGCGGRDDWRRNAPDGFYVWQRDWSDNVAAAVQKELRCGAHELFVLGGELEIYGAAWRWKGPAIPRDVLAHEKTTVVFRVSVKALANTVKAAGEIVARSRSLGVSRIQIDADVPERRLDKYAELLEAVSAELSAGNPGFRLGATFLPCHLDHSAMRWILASIDVPVIQLHGVDPPKDRSHPWQLMNRATVLKALKKARRLDTRFRMAVPDYAYVLVFGKDGKFRRLFAEVFPTNAELRDDIDCEIAPPDIELLCDIFSSPSRLPAIWFRLPVPGADRWCLER